MTEHCDIDRQKFKELLYKLSESINYGDSLEDRKDIYNHFEDLYCNPELNSFNRHYYSDIFEVMSAIKDEGTSEHTLDALILNIEALFSNYYADTLNQEKLIDLYPVIKKLYDHISLERSRMDYVDKSLAYSQTIGLTVESLNEKNKQIENNIANNTARWEIEVNDQKAKVAELKDSIRNYELKMDDFSSNLDNTSKKLDKAQIDYISILGIFSSIVLAFTGGITFSSSVLDNISNANIYFLIIITSLIGIVFATIIFMLFNAIHIISGKYNVKYAFIKSLTPLIIIIALFIGVIVLTYCGWRGGIVEGRDNRVSKQYKSNVTKIIETTEATETTNTLESSQVDIMTETADTE